MDGLRKGYEVSLGFIKKLEVDQVEWEDLVSCGALGEPMG